MIQTGQSGHLLYYMSHLTSNIKYYKIGIESRCTIPIKSLTMRKIFQEYFFFKFNSFRNFKM